jgi:acyl dehydratase
VSDAGAISAEAISRVQRRLGVSERSRQGPFNEFATTDTIRHYAHGFGDDNPLWCDLDYANSSPWGSVIAPPMFPISAGVPEPVVWTDEQSEAMSGGDPLRGVGQYLRADRWTFAGPVRIGARLTKRRALVKAELTEPGSFAGGKRGAVMCWRVVYSDDRDPVVPVAVNEREFYYTERDASPHANRRSAIAHYEADALKAIDDTYRSETRRGSDTFTGNDVKVGETLVQIVRGPLTVTDVMGHHVGTGLGGQFGVGPLRLGFLNRERVKGFYNKNSSGVYDVVQRCHWENEWANSLGHPAAYDYGMMRMTWLSQFVTDWAGDGATMVSFDGSARRFNYMGDTQWIGGRVEQVVPDRDATVVHLVVEGTNQDGEMTCTARISVRLPDSPSHAAPVRPINEAHYTFDPDSLVQLGMET